MSEHVIARTEELDDGDRILCEVEGRQIAVFRLDDEYHAYTNWCPHQAGPVCEGTITGTWDADFDRETLEVRMDWCNENEILSCPWHGWEYDVTSGESLSSDAQLLSHPVRVEHGEIIVSV